MTKIEQLKATYEQLGAEIKALEGPTFPCYYREKSSGIIVHFTEKSDPCCYSISQSLGTVVEGISQPQKETGFTWRCWDTFSNPEHWEHLPEYKQEPEFKPFWEPKSGAYYHIRVDGSVSNTHTELNAIGNYYKTREDARKALDYQLAEQRLRKAVWNLNKGPAPKFDYTKLNYTLYLFKGEIKATVGMLIQVNPDWLWLHTEELAEQLIETHSEDLHTYLRGV